MCKASRLTDAVLAKSRRVRERKEPAVGAQADLSPDFAVALVADDGNVVVRVGGEIDSATAPVLRRALINGQADVGSNVADQPLVVDLSRVTFLGASGLEILARASARARRAGSEVVLRDPTPMITRLLEITGLVEVFRLEQTDQLRGTEFP